MNEDNRIDNFIQAIEEIFSGMDPRTAWPLNGAQVDAYFDVDEALDMYYRLNKLREKYSVKEIAKLMPEADIIRLFLQHNAIIGLKVAKKLKIKPITTEQIIDYSLLLFDILKQKTQNDIFCLDGKNLLLDNGAIEKILDGKWSVPTSDEEKREISFLAISASNLCYSLFYDIYMTGGFYIHGPYDVSKKFGENTILLIRDYHNLAPIDLWPRLKIHCEQMQIFGIYKDLDIKINFTNHPVSKTSIGDKLIAYRILVDGKELAGNQISETENLFEETRAKQTQQINALNNLDQVKKGIEIAYYLFKNLRQSMDDDWRPPKEINKTIEKFGDKFIKQFKYQEKPPIEHWKKLFDPRLDYY